MPKRSADDESCSKSKRQQCFFYSRLESSFVKTPKSLAKKGAIVNINNKDQKCFMWSILAHLHKQRKDPSRVTKYLQYENELNMNGIQFPVNFRDIMKFENQNPISVNVLAYDNKTGVYPKRITKEIREHHVDLLWLKDGEKGHYTLISNISRLLHQPGQHNGQKFYCYYCLHGFIKKHSLEIHLEDCGKFAMQKVVLPDDEHKWVKFSAIQKMMKVPFIIYADFESYLLKLQGSENKHAFTHAYEYHEPSGFSYLKVCADERRVYPPVVYRGPNVVDEFLKRMQQESDKVSEVS